MKTEEFKKQIEDEFKRHRQTHNSICREFALSRSVVEVGDIICDHVGSVRVVKIKNTAPTHGFPECVYHGQELTKKLAPRADFSHRYVYQHNLKAN